MISAKPIGRGHDIRRFFVLLAITVCSLFLGFALWLWLLVGLASADLIYLINRPDADPAPIGEWIVLSWPACTLLVFVPAVVIYVRTWRVDNNTEQGPPDVHILVAALGDSDVVVAREAITALGMIGPAAKDAIPTLERLAEHEDRQIAERAKAALRQVRVHGARRE